MSRFFVSHDQPDGWKVGLAQPHHWASGKSAHSLAHTWHPCDGFPTSVGNSLLRSELGPLELLAGIPEYKVPLPGGNAASQTDLLVLARTQQAETVVLAVEGKALEDFGDNTVADWRLGASPGKERRLAFLLEVLGLPDDEHLGGQRYQLVHRTASPLIEAARLNADHAVMLVHSFGGQNKHFQAFRSFARLMGAEVEIGSITRAQHSPTSLYLGWVWDPHPEVA